MVIFEVQRDQGVGKVLLIHDAVYYMVMETLVF